MLANRGTLKGAVNGTRFHFTDFYSNQQISLLWAASVHPDTTFYHRPAVSIRPVRHARHAPFSLPGCVVVSPRTASSMLYEEQRCSQLTDRSVLTVCFRTGFLRLWDEKTTFTSKLCLNKSWGPLVTSFKIVENVVYDAWLGKK